MRRPRSLLPRLLLLLCATGAALLLAELTCRLVDPPLQGRGRFFTANGLEVPLGEIIAFLTRMPESDSRHNLIQDQPHGMMPASLKLRIGYEPKPRWDYFDAQGSVAVDTNRLGLRDEEFPQHKQPGEFRVLALGDSLTYGQGVRLDLTWPQQLEARLRRERSGPVEVINAGFAAGPGVHSPDGYDRWVADNGIQFAPDVVVVGVCLNDLGAVPMLTYPIVRLQPVLGGFSNLLDRSVQFVRQRQARAGRHDYLADIERQPAAWQGTQRGLRALRDTCREAKAQLLVAVFPMFSQLEPELYPCRPLHELVLSFCQAEGIAAIDLLPDFLGKRDSDYWVHQADQHPNHEAMRIFAERIHGELRQRGWLGGG